MLNYTLIESAFAQQIGFKKNYNVPNVASKFHTSKSGIYLENVMGIGADILNLIYESLTPMVSCEYENTMSFIAGTNKITQTTGDFTLKHKVNDIINITGTVNNNFSDCVITAVSALYIELSGVTLVSELNVATAKITNQSRANTPDINNYLDDVLVKQTNEGLRTFINYHKEFTKSKSINGRVEFSDQYWYDVNDKVVNENLLCGIKISFYEKTNMKLNLNQIGLQFDSLQTNLPVYLFVDSLPNYIAKQTITTTQVMEFVDLTDFFLHYRSEYGINNSFYLVYYQKDITGQAIKNLIGNCKKVKGVLFEGIYFSETDQPGAETLPRPIQDYQRITDVGYGIHLKATLRADITQFIIDNKDVLIHYLSLRIASKVLWDIYQSTNFNTITQVIKQKVIENMQKIDGEVMQEIKNLQLDFSALDELSNKPEAKLNKTISIK